MNQENRILAMIIFLIFLTNLYFQENNSFDERPQITIDSDLKKDTNLEKISFLVPEQEIENPVKFTLSNRNIFQKKVLIKQIIPPVKKPEESVPEVKPVDQNEVIKKREELLKKTREEERRRKEEEERIEREKKRREGITELKKIRVFGSMKKGDRKQFFVNYKGRVNVVFLGDTLDSSIEFYKLEEKGVWLRHLYSGAELLIPLN